MWRLHRITLMAFAYLCLHSMMYHLLPEDDPWKLSMLKLDFHTQHLASLLTCFMQRPVYRFFFKSYDNTYDNVIILSIRVGIVVMCTLTSARLGNLRNEKVILWSSLLQGLSAFAGNGFDFGKWWAMSLAFRLITHAVPNAFTHGIFHLAVLKAFDDMWKTWTI